MNQEIDYLNLLRSDLATAAEMQEDRRRRARRSRRRRYTAALVIVAAVGFGVGLVTAGHSSRASADGVLPGIAASFAKQMGDAHPSRITYWLSTRQTANRAAGGDIVPGNEPVYLIALKGHFTDPSAKAPGTTTQPTGTVLTLILNQNTFQLTDLGVSDQWPNTKLLGPAHTP